MQPLFYLILLLILLKSPPKECFFGYLHRNLQNYKFIQFRKQMKKVHPLQIYHKPESRRRSADQTAYNSENAKCRFCKQNISDKMYLTTPCQCLDAIHTYCVPQEMKAVIIGEIISSRPVRKYCCKKCKGTIRFEAKESLQCRSCEEIGKFLRNNQGICTWLMIGVLSVFVLLVFLVLLTVKPEIFTSESISYNSALIATAITLGTVTILVLFFLFSSMLCKRISKVTILASGRDRKMSSMVEIIQIQ